jgi:hypothetical protein
MIVHVEDIFLTNLQAKRFLEQVTFGRPCLKIYMIILFKQCNACQSYARNDLRIECHFMCPYLYFRLRNGELIMLESASSFLKKNGLYSGRHRIPHLMGGGQRGQD